MNSIKQESSQDIVLGNYRTPHSNKKLKCSRKCKGKSEHVDDLTPVKTRETPLPLLGWADSKEVWQNMVFKEEATLRTRNCRLFDDRSSFLPRMRAILLDWIMEVCEVYHLRRVTYYLSIDYIDRYLTIRPSIPKSQLQLIGISCLFIAAKLEEIYPPRLSEFSYVCDGACTEQEILACEVVMLNSLNWDINPMTPSGWLSLYMQIHFDAELVKKQKMHEDIQNNFLYPQYSGYKFVRASHLVDLFSLDPGFLKFSYSVIAAGAMYYNFGRKIALSVSGLTWDQLKICVEYMCPFYNILRDMPDPKLNSVQTLDSEDGHSFTCIRVKVPNIISDENHAYQTHTVNLDCFESATILRLEQMGLRVQKTLVKTKKKCKKQKSSEDNQDGESNQNPESTEEEDEEATVIMFEIEKMPDIRTNTEIQVLPESLREHRGNILTTLPATEVADSDIHYFLKESITHVSFDEILLGINDCTNKLLPPPDIQLS